MQSCTLNWNPERGFELDLDVEADDVTLRMIGVPVPADGTLELSQGVELHRLDVLFKSHVEVDGEPGQVHECTVRLEGQALAIEARVEDVETGEIVPVKASVPVRMPAGVPEAGGPKPQPADEDELDWEDETTLEKMVVEPGDRSPAPAPASGEPSAKGLQALLKALVDGPSDELTDEVDLTGEAPLPPPPAPVVDEAEAEDQSMSADREALALIELLVNGDNLELEDDHEAMELTHGVAAVLALPFSAERKAGQLSEWLLEQDAVADLYIGDEDLAEILEQW